MSAIKPLEPFEALALAEVLRTALEGQHDVDSALAGWEARLREAAGPQEPTGREKLAARVIDNDGDVWIWDHRGGGGWILISSQPSQQSWDKIVEMVVEVR